MCFKKKAKGTKHHPFLVYVCMPSALFKSITKNITRRIQHFKHLLMFVLLSMRFGMQCVNSFICISMQSALDIQ